MNTKETKIKPYVNGSFLFSNEETYCIIQRQVGEYIQSLQQENERLKELSGVMIAEIDSSPMAVQFFDLRIVNELKSILKDTKQKEDER